MLAGVISGKGNYKALQAQVSYSQMLSGHAISKRFHVPLELGLASSEELKKLVAVLSSAEELCGEETANKFFGHIKSLSLLRVSEQKRIAHQLPRKLCAPQQEDECAKLLIMGATALSNLHHVLVDFDPLGGNQIYEAILKYAFSRAWWWWVRHNSLLASAAATGSVLHRIHLGALYNTMEQMRDQNSRLADKMSQTREQNARLGDIITAQMAGREYNKTEVDNIVKLLVDLEEGLPDSEVLRNKKNLVNKLKRTYKNLRLVTKQIRKAA